MLWTFDNNKEKNCWWLDLYPDIFGGPLRNKKLEILYKILDYIYLNLRNFDYVISCCEPIKNIQVGKYKLPSRKIQVVNNWSLVDSDILEKNNAPLYKDGMNIKMLLTGNVGKVHLYKNTGQILRKFIVGDNKINKLEMYTRGAHYLDIYNDLKDLKNVTLLKTISANELVKAYDEPSITIVPLTRQDSNCAFPTRVQSAIASSNITTR